MKKIIILFEGTAFSDDAFDFACQLNFISPVQVTGIFTPQLDYADTYQYTAHAVESTLVPLLIDKEVEQVESNIEVFKKLCEDSGINYQVHKSLFDFTLPDLIKETRFADLLIIDSRTLYKDSYTEISSFINDALHASECPVLVVPPDFRFPEKNILAYDGSESSVYAIKKFYYLFPELRNKETLLVFSKENESSKIPERQRLEELVKQHFTDVAFFERKFNGENTFSNWITRNHNGILVCGSFGRTYISETFRKSFVRDVISQHKIPVFIAHK